MFIIKVWLICLILGIVMSLNRLLGAETIKPHQWLLLFMLIESTIIPIQLRLITFLLLSFMSIMIYYGCRSFRLQDTRMLLFRLVISSLLFYGIQVDVLFDPRVHVKHGWLPLLRRTY